MSNLMPAKVLESLIVHCSLLIVNCDSYEL